MEWYNHYMNQGLMVHWISFLAWVKKMKFWVKLFHRKLRPRNIGIFGPTLKGNRDCSCIKLKCIFHALVILPKFYFYQIVS